MLKKIFITSFLFSAAFVFSGCSTKSVVPAKNPMANATFIRSEDGAETWNPKMNIDGKKTIAGIDVLSMAIKPDDPSVVYIGTDSNGLFVTKDAGETWKQVPFPNKVYGLVFDPQNTNIMYGSGVFNGRAKIFKRLQEELEWKEIYTEPADGTIISSLAIDRTNSQVLYAGTSKGVIIKTEDGGETWVNLKKTEKPIIGIGIDAADSSHVFFGLFQKGLFETKDSGKTINDAAVKNDSARNISSVYSIVSDPNLPGVIYVGTGEGIFRRAKDEKWSSINIIGSSKAFPIRSIAINPQNSDEILYSSAKAIYKSVDSGKTWATFQLDTEKEIGVVRYDPSNSSRVYAGFRKF